MPDPSTDDTEAPAFAAAGPLETPAGESPPLPDTDKTDEGDALVEPTLADEIGEEAPDSAAVDVIVDFDEGAPGSPVADVVYAAADAALADAEAAATAAESALQTFEAGGVPTIDTDHEIAAYGSGYRAGGDDPGYLLTLAELRRHLGSFFLEEEEEAFTTLNGDDFWSRWTLGYLDATAGRMARLEAPRKREEMDW